jgi:hypothetical protein
MTPPAQAAEAARSTTAPAPSLHAGAPPPPVDEVEAATPENAGSRNPPGDKYKDEVARLLDAYEEKQARVAKERAEAERNAPEPEPEGLREGESWDAIYNAQPPEVQRAMAELRKMTTRKAQELAAERRKLEAQNQALLNSGILADLDQQAGAMPEDFDPFNPEHLQQVIEAKVASRLKQVLDPLQKQHHQAEAHARYQSFREQHPDLVEDQAVKNGVYKALQADPNLKLEPAYWMVKGKLLAAQRAEEADRAAVRRRAQQRAAQVPAAGRRPGTPVLDPDLKDLPAWQVYERLKARRE